MKLFDTAVDFLTGGVGSGIVKIADKVMKYFPASMNDLEKSELQLKIQQAENEKDIEMLKLANQADNQFNERIIAMEGAAEDLKSVPYIGAIIILFRGAQRPVWGFLTLYLDLMVFSKKWTIAEGSMEGTAFFFINLLVLTFLFGERAIKSILPIAMRFFGMKGNDK